MAVEIRELVIRTTVDNSAGGQKGGPKSNANSDAKDDLVAVCVDQVMDLLRLQKER